jgi:hypothetical protein
MASTLEWWSNVLAKFGVLKTTIHASLLRATICSSPLSRNKDTAMPQEAQAMNEKIPCRRAALQTHQLRLCFAEAKTEESAILLSARNGHHQNLLVIRYTPMEIRAVKCIPMRCTPGRYTLIRYMPVKYIPMRCMSMRCMPMKYMLMRFIPTRYTPMRYTPMRYTPLRFTP